MDKYCPRCMIVYRMSMDTNRPYSIVLPPHDPNCPMMQPTHPAPLLPLRKTNKE